MSQIHLSPNQEEIPAEIQEDPQSLWQDAWLRLKANRLAMFGLGFFIFIILLSYLGPLFYAHSPEEISLSLGATDPLSKAVLVEVRFDKEKASPDEVITIEEFTEIYAEDPEEDVAKLDTEPTVELVGVYFKQIKRFHVLGTDNKGRDLLARIMQGGRISLGVGFLATLVSLLIGVAYGAVAGYTGGNIDAFLMRVVDILYALPFLIFVILLMIAFEGFKHQILLIFVAIGAVEWLTMARIVRGQVVNLKNMEFIEAAKATGVKTRAIIARHLAPNILGPVVVYATLLVPAVMLLESTLSFLGLGVQAPDASWGTMIKEGAERMQAHPWQLVIPASFFSLTLFAMNFLGDGLRDALDVKTAKD